MLLKTLSHPENDDYELAHPDEYSSEAVDAQAMGKGKGRGKGQGQRGAGNKGGRGGRKPSIRGRTPNRSPQKPNAPRKPPGLNASARMFRIAPHPLGLIDPDDPPDPRSNLGQSVIKASNQLRLEHVGKHHSVRMGYSRDSSPSSAKSVFTSDVDFDEIPEHCMQFGEHNKRIITTAMRSIMRMKFNMQHPNSEAGLVRRAIEQRQAVTDAPDNEVDATVGGQRTPSVLPLQDAEIERSGRDNEVDATAGSFELF
eukprot:4470411-Amphidinium_carterae.1